MPDARALLREERAARQIKHPQAAYSSTGSLQCSLCRIISKSDTEVWNKHLRSSQHAMRAERLRVSTGRPASTSQEAGGDGSLLQQANKKRKAEESDDELEDSRKKNKQDIEQSHTQNGNEAAQESRVDTTTLSGSNPLAQEASNVGIPETIKTESNTDQQPVNVDEDEWAAFERDIARPPSPEAQTALNASATIIAAPVTATEAAVQSNDDGPENRRERREIEVEAEREDASRALEEEFDVMEGLEDRVKRLKEKREEIRKKARTEQAKSTIVDANDDEDESDEDFDDWDNWGRGRA